VSTNKQFTAKAVWGFKAELLILNLQIYETIQIFSNGNLLAELKKRLKISIFLWRKSCASR